MCWICRRNEKELPNSLKVKTSQELKIENLSKKVQTDKEFLQKRMNELKGKLPTEYFDFDFNFVLNNPGQFDKIKELSEVLYLKNHGLEINGVINDVDHASGPVISIGVVNFDLNAPFVERVVEYARKLRINDQLNFQGLKFKAGIDQLIRIAQSYYDLQLFILKEQLSEASSKRNLWVSYSVTAGDSVQMLKICSTCDKLVRQLAVVEAEKLVKRYN